MPIYEYTCDKCRKDFEELVFRDDQEVPCPKCGSIKTRKLMSACRCKFGSDSGESGAGSAASSGGGCSGCSGGSCSTCG